MSSSPYPPLAELAAYQRSELHFLPSLLPGDAVRLPARAVLDWLEGRLGKDRVAACLTGTSVTNSPRAAEPDGQWLRRSNMVGINVRTIGNFFNVVKYALTLPRAQDSVHLLPIWEPGVVASLYGMVSWEINPEFFSDELYGLVPALNTVERQLAATINLLHALGKSVGMDVIPHVDRYAEITLLNPGYFEWLRRRELTIVDHSADLYRQVEGLIFSWLRQNSPPGAAYGLPSDAAAFFAPTFPERVRRQLLFGDARDYGGRRARRIQIMDALYREGLEPVPATMAPPYRGLEVDPRPEALTVDADGRTWRDYRLVQPTAMSRAFGPLTRYQLYGRLDDNADWAIDFDRPRPAVWRYVQQRYDEVQYRYGFDFMRGDMSHVQMRPDGVPAQPDDYYDIHRAIKRQIRAGKPWFGYFAESFLAPPDYMGYGDEVAHLLASEADTTLGNLQSNVVGSTEFLQDFRDYVRIAQQTSLSPSFTVMTADKDDPRFDAFYLAGNEVRLFVALFLTELPSYVGAGFLQRDAHPTPAPNEHYTKLYVFRIAEGPKATHGPYVWGSNRALFARLTRIRRLADELLPELDDRGVNWPLPPAPDRSDVAWAYADTPYACWVNFSPDKSAPLPVSLVEYSVLEFAANPDAEYGKTAPDSLPPYQAFLLKK